MIMMKRYKKILLTGVLSALSCSFVRSFTRRNYIRMKMRLCMNG